MLYFNTDRARFPQSTSQFSPDLSCLHSSETSPCSYARVKTLRLVCPEQLMERSWSIGRICRCAEETFCVSPLAMHSVCGLVQWSHKTQSWIPQPWNFRQNRASQYWGDTKLPYSTPVTLRRATLFTHPLLSEDTKAHETSEVAFSWGVVQESVPGGLYE